MTRGTICSSEMLVLRIHCLFHDASEVKAPRGSGVKIFPESFRRWCHGLGWVPPVKVLWDTRGWPVDSLEVRVIPGFWTLPNNRNWPEEGSAMGLSSLAISSTGRSSPYSLF